MIEIQHNWDSFENEPCVARGLLEQQRQQLSVVKSQQEQSRQQEQQ